MGMMMKKKIEGRDVMTSLITEEKEEVLQEARVEKLKERPLCSIPEENIMMLMIEEEGEVAPRVGPMKSREEVEKKNLIVQADQAQKSLIVIGLDLLQAHPLLLDLP